MSDEVKEFYYVVDDVEVKSGWWSKINWAQILSVVATVLTAFGYVVPPDLIPAAVVVINGVTAFATIIFREFFTTKLTWGSVKEE